MRASLLGLFLAGCASVSGQVPLLAEKPDRPYHELARIESSGRIGAPREEVYEELRRKAAALGADAVLRLEEQRRYRAAPRPANLEDRASLGDAYPDLAETLRPGYFGYQGQGVATVAGYYWQVSAVAIDYAPRD